MKLTIGSRVRLNNGVEMPVFGLGTWMSTGRDARNAVGWALEAGYRLIDSAAAYGNEAEVGEAVRSSGIPRSEVFVTTKLWPSSLGYDSGLRAFEQSRRRLGFEQVDLYLIHWPGDDAWRRQEAWRALETLLADGRARAIGVSNYSPGEMEETIRAGRTVPAVNQVLFSPFEQRRDVHDFARTHEIRMEGYSTLTRGRRLKDEALREIAQARGRTPAQVVLRWAVQKDVTVIPKSVHRERILENAAVFDFSLSPEEMGRIDALGEE